MKLVEDWRDAPKWISMRVLALLVILPPVWLALPPDLKAYIPADWMPFIVSLVALGAALGRLKEQDL